MRVVQYGILAVTTLLEYLLIYMAFFGKKLKKNQIGKYKDLLITIAVFIVSTVVFYNDRTIAEVLFVLVAGLFMKFIFKMRFFETFKSLIMAVPIASIIETAMRIFSCKIAPDNSYVESVARMLLTSTFCFIIYILIGRKMDESISNLNTGMYITLIVVSYTLVLMLTFFQFILDGIDQRAKYEFGNYLVVVGGVAIIVSLYNIIFYLYGYQESRIKGEALTEMNMVQKNQLQLVINQNNETRRFKHEIIDQLLVVKDRLEAGDVETAEKVVHQNLKNIDRINSLVYDVHNDILNFLLNYYLVPIKDECHISINIEPTDLGLDESSLCIVVSNILRNAVEAVNGINEGEKSIIVRMGHGEKTMFFEVVNTYNKGRKKRIRGEKDDVLNHGFGITNVKNVIENNSGIFESKVDGNKCTTTIFVPKVIR